MPLLGQRGARAKLTAWGEGVTSVTLDIDSLDTGVLPLPTRPLPLLKIHPQPTLLLGTEQGGPPTALSQSQGDPVLPKGTTGCSQLQWKGGKSWLREGP